MLNCYSFNNNITLYALKLIFDLNSFGHVTDVLTEQVGLNGATSKEPGLTFYTSHVTALLPCCPVAS